MNETVARSNAQRSPRGKSWIRPFMRKVWISEHRSSTIAVVLASASGLLVLWIVKDQVGASGDAVYVAALLLPTLVFAISSGLVTELKAAGFEAKFRDFARRPIATSRKASSFQEFGLAEKGNVRDLDIRVRRLSGTQPVLLVIDLGRPRDFSVRDLEIYLDRLSEFRKFLFVVFTDLSSSVIGYMRPEDFRAATTREGENNRGSSLVRLLNQGEIQRFRDEYAHILILETISFGATIRAALAKMVEQRLDAMLVVTPSNRRLVAVAERDLLIAELVLAATDGHQRTAENTDS